MTQLNEDTQPVRAIQSGRRMIRRFVLFLLLAIGIVGSIAFGFALGIGGILVPARVIVLTAIASIPISIDLQLIPEMTVVESQGGGGGRT